MDDWDRIAKVLRGPNLAFLGGMRRTGYPLPAKSGMMDNFELLRRLISEARHVLKFGDPPPSFTHENIDVLARAYSWAASAFRHDEDKPVAVACLRDSMPILHLAGIDFAKRVKANEAELDRLRDERKEIVAAFKILSEKKDYNRIADLSWKVARAISNRYETDMPVTGGAFVRLADVKLRRETAAKLAAGMEITGIISPIEKDYNLCTSLLIQTTVRRREIAAGLTGLEREFSEILFPKLLPVPEAIKLPVPEPQSIELPAPESAPVPSNVVEFHGVVRIIHERSDEEEPVDSSAPSETVVRISDLARRRAGGPQAG